MNSLRAVAAVSATLLVLMGCAQTGRGPSAADGTPMSAPELLQLLTSGQDFERQGADGATSTWHFVRDGTVSASGVGVAAEGRWRIAGDRYCLRWVENAEAERCFRAYRQGDSVFALEGLDGEAAGTLTTRH
ncbi:MAG: hypothetical protein KDG52_09640 [Rhodocyclaceae bacterium]|nr:hypothetical protein [Rhodocyclaceae bacterium]